ncbi:uri1, prefoldin-like chaperone [Chytridiales sp. JEL 0842]|nr:uri1, prefoldin-like chaperone [Chytridiales sp. JEL 0842]
MQDVQWEQYKKKLLNSANEDLIKLEKVDKDYEKLDAFLEQVPLSLRRKHKVPIGKLAFMDGELIHTNEVLVSLGENYFAECSAAQAREIVTRRREYMQTNIEAKKKHIAELKLRFSFSENSVIDNDGDEVNEEGLKFVEIREEVDDDGILQPDPKVLGAAVAKAKPEPKPEAQPKPEQRKPTPSTKPSQPSKSSKGKEKLISKPKDVQNRQELGEFERNLLEKLDAYEKEEQEHGMVDVDDEEELEDDQDEESDGMDGPLRKSKGLGGEEESDSEQPSESESDDEEPDVEIAAPIAPERQPRTTVKSERIVPEIKEKPMSFETDFSNIKTPADIYKHMLRVKESATPSPEHSPKRSSKPPNDSDDDEPLGAAKIFKDDVIEHEDMDSLSESDFEDYILGREVANEYQQMRQKILAMHETKKDFVSDELKNELAVKEEERTVSVFKAKRLITEEVTPVDKSLLEYFESTKCAAPEYQTKTTPAAPKVLPSSANNAPKQSKRTFKPVLKSPKSSTPEKPKLEKHVSFEDLDASSGPLGVQQAINQPQTNLAVESETTAEIEPKPVGSQVIEKPGVFQIDEQDTPSNAKPRISKFKEARMMQQQQQPPSPASVPAPSPTLMKETPKSETVVERNIEEKQETVSLAPPRKKSLFKASREALH